jgi:transposase
VRVTTAFNRLLRLPGASVTGVAFGGEGVVVKVRLRRRRSACSACGQLAPIHDRSTRRWRHLDLGANRCHAALCGTGFGRASLCGVALPLGLLLG